MVVTVLQARVSPDRWKDLEREFSKAVERLDPGIEESFLLHGFASPESWQILTVWKSREIVDKMRSSEMTPRGVEIFRAAGAEPMLSVFDVPARGRKEN